MPTVAYLHQRIEHTITVNKVVVLANERVVIVLIMYASTKSSRKSPLLCGNMNHRRVYPSINQPF